MMLPLLVLLLLSEEPPHRAMTEATLRVKQRTVTWTFVQCREDEDGKHVLITSKPQVYILDFSRTTLSVGKRSKMLAKDHNDLAEIAMIRALLPRISRVRDECHVKDKQVWRSIFIDAVEGEASVEFAGRKRRPTLNYRGTIGCDSYEVGLDAEDTAQLNVTIRALLDLLVELTAWFDGVDDVGNIARGNGVSWTGQ